MNNKPHLKYGVPFAAVSVLIYLGGLILLKLPATHFLVNWSPTLLLLAAIVLSTLEYRKQNDKNGFGHLFANGFRTTAVFTVIVGVIIAAYLASSPGFQDLMLKYTMESAKQQGYTAEMIQENDARMRSMLIPFVLGGIVISQLIAGAIFSAISAIAFKKQ
ncbi:DUF4199 domain-containing protein [Chitinophaga horti]|uniref:DUF4199 domain-containing protein n=1 Tax=Chitinophaga horti TaxID=2920382 RepID=A0ABY6J546_9BACT|nr:DUF4199 domain-containing protein [Chitinophaga horti]UYQ94793.1 DUF4199 domain-containing protein [Chitinophaga horti]